MKTKNIILIITAITGSIMIIMGLSYEMRRPIDEKIRLIEAKKENQELSDINK